MSQAVLESFHESAQASSLYPLAGKGHLCEAALPEVSGKQDACVLQSGIPSLWDPKVLLWGGGSRDTQQYK